MIYLFGMLIGIGFIISGTIVTMLGLGFSRE
jgi:hypothetical protein